MICNREKFDLYQSIKIKRSSINSCRAVRVNDNGEPAVKRQAKYYEFYNLRKSVKSVVNYFSRAVKSP